MIHLPIDEILPQLHKAVVTSQNIIIHAPPGAGKTTRVPSAVLASLPDQAGKVIMLEPRRIAALSAAQRIADTLCEEVGHTVGYSIRFDSRTSENTRIHIVTEGILTRMIQVDPGLEGVAAVIFDEFHERSVHADLGLALCREVQQLRPDLKIIVMSATLDLQPLSVMLDNAPVISSAGRSFPVEIRYLEGHSEGRLVHKMAAAIRLAIKDTAGNILAFLPGIAEIRRCARELEENCVGIDDLKICQLYGDLPIKEQQAIIRSGAQRKIVLATSLAETSLTIDGITTVIDSGLTRCLRYDASTGLNRLITVKESRSSAEQRAGRAGRLQAGVCYRLYSQHSFHTMLHHAPPEITSTDLAPLLLELAVWGVHDPHKLQWLDSPPVASIEVARRLLHQLGLFTPNYTLTQAGKKAVRLPVHPRLGKMLLRAEEMACIETGCRIAALLSERDLFRNGGFASQSESLYNDFSDRAAALVSWQNSGYSDARCDVQSLKRVDLVFKQLMRFFEKSNVKQHYDEPDVLAALVLAAYPDRLARLRSGGGYLLCSGRGARLSDKCAHLKGDYLVVPQLDGGNESEAVIHLALEVPESVIRKECKDIIEKSRNVEWDSREGRVTAVSYEHIGAVRLSESVEKPLHSEAVPHVLSAVCAEGLAVLPLSDEFRKLQNRLLLVKKIYPENHWPDFSDIWLVNNLKKWLEPNLTGIYSLKKLAGLDLAAIVRQMLDYRQQRELDELAPLQITVPSGSNIKIDYSSEVPVLAVKLQELFGLAQGPVICGGRVPLQLNLLSPAGRPVQITTDLAGFWNGSYQQVKKELKGRYPKHPWPDNPWTAVPTRRVKSKQ